MAREVTVGATVDMVQVMVEDPLHKLATETDYIARIDRAYARLHAMYVEAEPDRYRTEATITGDGTIDYPLPADWLSTIGIDAVSGNQRTELERLQEEQRNDYIGQTGVARAFRIVGTNVLLYPIPQTGQTYTHIYLPRSPVLTAAISPASVPRDNTIDCRNGHEDWLEKVVARDLLQMKQEYDGRWDEDIARLELELKHEANWRYFTDNVTLMQKRNRRPWPYGPGVDIMGPWQRLPRP